MYGLQIIWNEFYKTLYLILKLTKSFVSFFSVVSICVS